MHRILMVEDDFDFAEILIECLQADPDCVIAEIITNQAQARAKFETGILDEVDVILMDLQLAKSSADHNVNTAAGLLLIVEARQRHNFQGTIIVLTSSNSLEDGEAALEAGCDGYLCKHTRMGELPSLLAELRMAIRGEVVLVAKEMRHVFLRQKQAGSTDARTYSCRQ